MKISKPKDLHIKGTIDYEKNKGYTHVCGQCFIHEGKRCFEIEYNTAYIGGNPKKVLKWLERAVMWVQVNTK